MNTFFIILLGIYLLVFIGISILDAKKASSFSEYAVAGKKQGFLAVTMTLLATVLGASTTIGITDTVYQIGFPGIWWLVFGAVGLILQSLIISERVRGIDADTLPDLAGRIVGKPAEILLALIIVISWVGVIAGQFVALGSIVGFATGINSRALVAAISLIVIVYTMFGGQLSVVKTDKIQFVIILVGLVVSVLFLYLVKGSLGIASQVELMNESYRPINLFNQFFVIGGVYFLGPDIMSRNFLAKDGKTAKRSSLFAGIVLVAISLVITFIGLWVRTNVSAEELGDSKALMYVASIIPKGISFILVLGLISAIISSTDTCIINASTIFVKDVLRKDSIKAVRVTVLVMGIASVILALAGRGDIMSLLTGAYSIYTPGIIFPLFIAIMVNDKKRIRLSVWMTAVIIGGLFGIMGTYFTDLITNMGISAQLVSYLPLIGMFMSLVISAFSIRKKIKQVG